MNNTCGKCGGYVGDFIYSGTGAVICNCTPLHKEEKCIAMWKPCSEDHNSNCYYCGRNMLSPTPDSMEKKPGAYDTFDMDDVKEGRVECVVGDPTDSLEKEFDEEYDGCCLGATQGASDANKKDLKVFISQVRQKAVKETLQFIALKEGWEESEEHYAKLLGIDLSDNK